MSKNTLDIVGKKFGKLTVLKLHHKEKIYSKFLKKDGTKRIGGYRKYYTCKCDCGSYKIINGSSLKRGLSKSCGCLFNELRKKGFNKKHGKTYTRLYNIWISMKQRCYNKNRLEFKYWGGKGVKVCKEWLNNFMAFYEWSMKNGYNDKLSIDRIDGDGNYCPENCRWATAQQQAINQKKPKHITLSKEVKEKISNRMGGNIYSSKYLVCYFGNVYPLKRFCKKFGKSYYSVLDFVKKDKDLSKFFGVNVVLKRRK